ncbi:ATP-binding protein [Kutzneria viridogrisea]|uniref:histidine kinase n=2 Tax=Kutzneria TaxID=43356 RepID=W5W6Y6_9PSEU|nr:HAMP domain-containing sensor histidine kinase [Kutzneria albida]AHH93974.1 integral membrane sensor signal transduction histidine kinase [Kutzneria albida DSM 43870]MBA8931021.1 signal transduction histidine kinase [Kutzneria viridogrisea]
MRRRVGWAMAGTLLVGLLGWQLLDLLGWLLTSHYYGGFLWFQLQGGTPTTATFFWILTVATVGLVFWLSRRMLLWALRPLTTITTAVSQLGPHNLGQRLRQPGAVNDPLRRLADTLDEVLDRLAAGFDGQRRFAANASHELRTPLAVQRMLVELALETSKDVELRRLGAQLLLTNERNERLIEGLLVLAESDRGLTGHVPVRLDELVVGVLDAHNNLAAEHGVRLEREGSEVTVPGDPVLLERMITNLVQNGIKYNRPEGSVRVLVETGRLVVRNTGERVPAESVAALFEPFRRLARDRTGGREGAGLGLSIVRSIATAHGGTASAEPGIDGGLSVTISLATA